MDFFDDHSIEDGLEGLSDNMDFGDNHIEFDNSSLMDEWETPDLANIDSGSLFVNEANTGNVSFMGHLEELYNPEIQRAQENYDFHISKLVDSSDLSDLKYHLEKADQAKGSEQFFQDCLEEARRNQTIDEARLDSITQPAEIAKQYQQEIEDILYPNKRQK